MTFFYGNPFYLWQVLLVLSTAAIVLTIPLSEEYKEFEAAQNVSIPTVTRIGCSCSLREKQRARIII